MAFWARPNGELPAELSGVQLEPVAAEPGGMADAMMRKMTGIGLSDVQNAAASAGEMLADFKARLERIELNQTEILAQLAYLATRGAPSP